MSGANMFDPFRSNLRFYVSRPSRYQTARLKGGAAAELPTAVRVIRDQLETNGSPRYALRFSRVPWLPPRATRKRAPNEVRVGPLAVLVGPATIVVTLRLPAIGIRRVPNMRFC